MARTRPGMSDGSASAATSKPDSRTASDVTGPINLGNPDEVQIIDLAKEILQLTGSQSSISFQPLPEDDPKVRCPDTSQAERLLGWRSKVSRKEGLQCVIPYFQEKLKVNHHGRSC